MSLSDSFKPDASCSGGIAGFGEMLEVIDQIEGFLRVSLPRILPHINPLRTSTQQSRNEKDLCAELGKRLNFEAHGEMFHFYPEDPENESASRTLDYGAYPQVHIRVGSRSLGATDRLYAIEAKRLPTHTSSIDQPLRQREYVVGDWDVRETERKRVSGGIERFKEGLHAETLERVGMIGFVQRGCPKEWLAEINAWIADLVQSPPLKSHKAPWKSSDLLREVSMDVAGVSELHSVHDRQQSTPIRITHFWLKLHRI